MQLNDLVTIVVPAYNAEQFLRENIESILGQTYQKLEVIYVCDGCTDNTVNILMEYSEDERLKIHIEKENHGAAVSRNIGMEMGNGDWYIFFDSDDVYEKDMIELLLSNAIQYGADISCCYYDMLEKPSGVINNQMRKKNIAEYPIFQPKKNEKYLLQMMMHSPCTKLVNKKIIRKDYVRFQDIPNCNDVYYSASAEMEADKIVFVDKNLFHYRCVEKRNTLSVGREERESYILEAYDEIYNLIKQKDNNSQLLISFYNKVIGGDLLYYSNKAANSKIKDKLRMKYLDKWKLKENSTLKMLSYVNRFFLKYYLYDSQNIEEGEDYIDKAAVDWIIDLYRQDKDICLWGAGVKGQKLISELYNNNIIIKYWVDSDSLKQGTLLGESKVQDYYEIKEKVKNIVVASYRFYDEITDKINDKGKRVYNLYDEIYKI
jgi:glycosyltransferase involved in cell wall biosynthesis